MTRPTLVFSHGNSFPAGTYTQLLQALQTRGFDTLAIDRLGHDPRFGVGDNWPGLVAQLQDFVRPVVAERGPVFLVGHSLGGFVSLLCAAQHPALARGVVMLDSPLIGGWRASSVALAKRAGLIGRISPGAVSRQRRTHWPDADSALAHFAQKKSFARWQPEVLRDYIAHGTQDAQGQRVLRFDRDIETTIYNTIPHQLGRTLRRHPLQCPAAFVGGLQSQELKQVGLALTRRICQQRVAMVDGSHLFPMEQPQATAALVEAALRNMGACPPHSRRLMGELGGWR